MNNEHDQDLRRHLDGESDVSRAYASLPRERPDAALDERILAAARSAAARPRRPAWMAPTALAATLMLAVSLSWQQLRAPATMQSEIPQPAAPQRDEAQRVEARELAEPRESAPAMSRRLAPAAAGGEESELQPESTAAATYAPAPAAAPAPSPVGAAPAAPTADDAAASGFAPAPERAAGLAAHAPARAPDAAAAEAKATGDASGSAALPRPPSRATSARRDDLAARQREQQREDALNALASHEAASYGAVAGEQGADQAGDSLARAEESLRASEDDGAQLAVPPRVPDTATAPTAHESGTQRQAKALTQANAEASDSASNRAAGSGSPSRANAALATTAAPSSEVDSDELAAAGNAAASSKQRLMPTAPAHRDAEPASALAGYRDADRYVELPPDAAFDIGESTRANPARFLDAIRARYASNEIDRAKTLLREFRERYPDYPLPDDFPLPEPELTGEDSAAP